MGKGSWIDANDWDGGIEGTGEGGGGGWKGRKDLARPSIERETVGMAMPSRCVVASKFEVEAWVTAARRFDASETCEFSASAVALSRVVTAELRV